MKIFWRPGHANVYPDLAVLASGTEAPSSNSADREMARLVIGAWKFFGAWMLGFGASAGQERVLPHRPLLFLKHLYGVPGVVRGRFFVLQRAVQIHLRQIVVRIKFEELREHNFRLLELACSKVSQAYFVVVDPLHQLWIHRFVAPRAEDG